MSQKGAQKRNIIHGDAKNDIAVLCGPGPLPEIMINAIVAQFGAVTIIREEKEPALTLLKRRRKMLGLGSTTGQAAFGLFLKLVHLRSQGRISEIIVNAGLEPVIPDRCPIIAIGSVNDETCRAALRAAAPKVVLVAGTRMIRKPTLTCIDSPFINYHAGINPLYRGMNGGYWALANDDKVNAGVCVHLVDEGVDTGAILYVARFEITEKDNFVTYPYLQASVAQPLVVKALDDALNERLAPIEIDLPSKQWFHPTLWGYLWHGMVKGVW